MTLPVHEQLRRLADTLRNDVGPAVADEYTRTQAFMSSVILQRLAAQVEHGPRHSSTEAAHTATLHSALAGVLAAAPPDVAQARAEAAAAGTVASLGPLIRALYDWGSDRAEVQQALEAIRPVLRADIDRRMEIAT